MGRIRKFDFSSFSDRAWSSFSHDLGIDLGTSNTLVFVRGKGIVIREASMVARQKRTKEFLAIGNSAKKMLGKTPANIEAIKPLKEGVIADFDACEAMLVKFIRQVHQSGRLIPMIPRPRVVIGIPSGVTEVERRAVQDVCLSAGARKAFLIEEPMAAAIGLGLPIERPEGMLIVDIGGGTTEIAVISLGGIVISKCIRIASLKMDEAIAAYVRLRHSLLLGETTAEAVKLQVGSAYPLARERHLVVRGRGLEDGLPKSVKLSSTEIREALSPVVRRIMDSLSQVLEETPPELMADIVKKGISLSGGGSLLDGIDKLITEETKIPAWRSKNPMEAVVLGCGRALAEPSLLVKVKLSDGLR
ncbi:MAG: rod shape-determining protein [Candidatus Pacebacteria bacterium]|nr:rod shape-determining protein [Candidatus Paceibacterota bacterium]